MRPIYQFNVISCVLINYAYHTVKWCRILGKKENRHCAG